MGKPSVSQPDYAKATTDAVYTDLNLLPMRRLIEAASKTGGTTTVDGKTYDFAGLGDADNAGVVADQMAAALLDIQKTYGEDYVKQRLAELQASDPEGQTARKQLYQRIQDQMASPTNRPAAAALEQSVKAETEKGATLDEATTRELQQAVRGQQAARGNVLGNAAVAQEAGAVSNAGEALQTQREQKALDYLTSGVSPEDVEYRRMQQTMNNLGNFISGTTPEAQFKGLSSAGNGAAPFMGGGSLTTLSNPNAGQQGASNAMDIYRTQQNWAANQANPYTAGVGFGVQAAGTYLAATQPTNYGSAPVTPAGVGWGLGNR